MGRLRDDYERPLWMGITEEVVDLFGVDDVLLFRWSAADNTSNKDPLYSEPNTQVRFKQYKIKCLYLDYVNSAAASSMGLEFEKGNKIYVALAHLLKAQVEPDCKGGLIAEGDTIGLHYRGEYIEYDILQANPTGWVNDSDKFTGYNLDVKRSGKFTPERKTGGVA